MVCDLYDARECVCYFLFTGKHSCGLLVVKINIGFLKFANRSANVHIFNPLLVIILMAAEKFLLNTQRSFTKPK